MSIKWEQFRQARAIHGGFVGLCLAVLAVKLSRLPVPSRRIRRRLFRDMFVRKYPPGLNEQEAERPLDDYASFNALFTRGVKAEYRPIPDGTPEILSPCDGTVQDVGCVEKGRLLTVKGIEYSLGSMLASMDIGPYEGGQFAIIFLSPIDCHRVFSPQDGCLEEVIHVPGARLLVHPPFQRQDFPVYTLNERMIFRLSSPAGACVVIMVAGWGVGNITMPSAPNFRPGPKRIESWRSKAPQTVKRGDWIATFELGSSVLLFTASALEATPLVSSNDKVRYGQPVFRFATADTLRPR
jgi:phosphatidylserine decarboxylase